MIEQTIYGLLTASASITALVANRIYPIVVPQDSPVFPVLVYSIVGGSSTPTFSTTGIYKHRVQIDCYDLSYLSAVTLRDAVIASLDGTRSDNTTIQYLSSTDFFDHELLQYRAMTEFYIYSNQ